VKFEEAVKKLWADKRLKERTEKGYHLSSLLLTPTGFEKVREWQFVFFHPDTRDVFSVKVNAKGVEVGKESQPLVDDYYDKLDLQGVKPLEVLAIVKEEAKEFDQAKITKIILTLREGKWRAAVTTSDMKMLRVDVDRNTNKVEKSEITSMLR
jgi:hypothetical protein